MACSMALLLCTWHRSLQDLVTVDTQLFRCYLLATANAPILAGGKVIFADVDPNDGLMKPVHLEQALNEFPDHPIKAVFLSI